MIGDRERRASSLLDEEDNHIHVRSQKIQVYTVTVSGWQRRALWTDTAIAASYTGCHIRNHESIQAGVTNLLLTF